MDDYLNSRQACSYLGIKDLDTLYSYIKSGKLKAHKLGGNNKSSKRHWRIKRTELERFISGQDSEEGLTESSIKRVKSGVVT